MLQLSKEDIEAIADAVAARSRHASGAQPDSACDEIGWLVEITGPRYWTGTPGCGNWTADSLAAMRFARRQDAEAACRHLAPSGAIPVEHAWVSHRPAGAQPSGAPTPASAQVCAVPGCAYLASMGDGCHKHPFASAQGEVCECGHIAAIHDDPHGDGAHGGSCLEIIGKCSDGSDDFCCCSEFHHAQ